ncbi:hypothetical protein BC827DRAFT_266779 [Russula dissimulans]|nr:hypothetical protein BC827DRAFT_266779 [Russula dissimulans]
MEATLQERLVNLEQQFLLAVLSNDEKALEEFSREQAHFLSHIKAAEASRKLDDKTALLSSYVAGSIENVASCLLHSEEIFQDAQSRLSDLIRELPPNAFETLSHSPPIPPHHLLFSHHPPSMQGALGQHKTLDAYAYRWLMQNLHNPYPTNMQVQILGDLSGTSAAQVEIWFKEMRDAIGWTKLSREFFASSPNATVAAARRVYLERGNDIPFDVVFAFTALKAFAETQFTKHSAIQAKHFNEGHHLSLALSDMSAMPEAQGRYTDSEGVSVPFPVNSSIPPVDFPYLSDDDESEEEDTTPPLPWLATNDVYLEISSLRRILT